MDELGELRAITPLKRKPTAEPCKVYNMDKERHKRLKNKVSKERRMDRTNKAPPGAESPTHMAAPTGMETVDPNLVKIFNSVIQVNNPTNFNPGCLKIAYGASPNADGSIINVHFSIKQATEITLEALVDAGGMHGTSGKGGVSIPLVLVPASDVDISFNPKVNTLTIFSCGAIAYINTQWEVVFRRYITPSE